MQALCATLNRMSSVYESRFKVIVAVDTPTGRKERGHELRVNEFCQGNWGEYHVLVVPGNERADIIQDLFIEPMVCLSPREAYFIISQVCDLRLSFVSQGPEAFPTVGYMLHSRDLKWMPPPSEFHHPVRAIRIIMDDVRVVSPRLRREPWIDFGILDLNCIQGWTSVVTVSGEWQSKVWAACIEAVPDVRLEPTQLQVSHDPNRPFERLPRPQFYKVAVDEQKHLRHSRREAQTPDAMNVLSETDRRYLTASVLHRFFESLDLTDLERGKILMRLQMWGDKPAWDKLKVLDSKIKKLRAGKNPDKNAEDDCLNEIEKLDPNRGSIRNFLADAGLKALGETQAKRFFAFIQRESPKFYQSNSEAADEADSSSVGWSGAKRILGPLLQPMFHDFLSYDDISAFEQPR